MTISEWLKIATSAFKKAGINSSELDALILLEDAIGINRASLLAHLDRPITKAQLKNLNKNLQQRIKRIPLAYIRGHAEFYGRDFVVNKNVMIPRPESEAFLELVEQLKLKAGQKVIDIGTGSGALAISIKLNFPALNVSASDLSPAALEVAKHNATTLNASDIKFYHSDLFDDIKEKYDCILANLPYVPVGYTTSREVDFEPKISIYAKNNGLELIQRLIIQVNEHIQPHGYLLLESLKNQHLKIIDFAEKNKFSYVSTKGLVQLFRYQK